MKVNKLYPVDVFEFQFSSEEDWVSRVQKQKLDQRNETGILNTWLELHKVEAFEPMVDFFHECLDEIQDTWNYDCDGFKVTSMWANYYRPGVRHTAHRHANSYWSGILYLTDGAPTVFYDPIQMRSFGQFELYTKPTISTEGFNQNAPVFETISAEAGKCIIFPSWFVHDTAYAEEDRYTVSFNALPTGRINDGIANIRVL